MNYSVNSVQGSSIHQESEIFSKPLRERQCSFMVLSALFHNESIQYCSLVGKSVIDRILHHGDGMYYSDELSNS